MASPANIRQGLKGLPGKSTLAYYEIRTLRTKMFYNIGPLNLELYSQDFTIFVTYEWAKWARVFVTGEHFRPSVM